jgi:hypothetical protein
LTSQGQVYASQCLSQLTLMLFVCECESNSLCSGFFFCRSSASHSAMCCVVQWVFHNKGAELLERRPRHHRRRLLGERSRLSRGSPLSHYMHAASKLVGGYQLAVCFHKFLGACKCGLVRILAQGSRQRWLTCGEQTGCLGSFRHPPALLKGLVWFWFSTPVLRRRVQLRILFSLPESALPSIPDLPRRPRHHRRRLLGERSRLSRGSPLSHYMHAASKLVGQARRQLAQEAETF